LDLCETPCRLSRWYAERTGASVSTRACDALEYAADAPYDVVFTHAFLGNFDADGRRALLGRWHALLRPGGRAITVQRIRPGHDGDVVAFTAAEAAAFRDHVLARARTEAARLDRTPQQLAELAFEYAARFRTHPVGTAAELKGAFVDAGFAIERFEPMAAQPVNGAISGPAIPAGAERIRIVAVRP
jgi:hypothetical protein